MTKRTAPEPKKQIHLTDERVSTAELLEKKGEALADARKELVILASAVVDAKNINVPLENLYRLIELLEVQVKTEQKSRAEFNTLAKKFGV